MTRDERLVKALEDLLWAHETLCDHDNSQQFQQIQDAERVARKLLLEIHEID